MTLQICSLFPVSNVKCLRRNIHCFRNIFIMMIPNGHAKRNKMPLCVVSALLWLIVYFMNFIFKNVLSDLGLISSFQVKYQKCLIWNNTVPWGVFLSVFLNENNSSISYQFHHYLNHASFNFLTVDTVKHMQS